VESLCKALGDAVGTLLLRPALLSLHVYVRHSGNNWHEAQVYTIEAARVLATRSSRLNRLITVSFQDKLQVLATTKRIGYEFDMAARQPDPQERPHTAP